MIMVDYITEQNEFQFGQQQDQVQQPENTEDPFDTEIEPIKKITIINLFYKLFITLNTSLDPRYSRVATLVENILKFSDVLSYQTLVELLDRVVAYLGSIKQQSDSEQ